MNKYILTLNDENRIIVIATWLGDENEPFPSDYIIVDTLPEGDHNDYLYIDGEYIYSPLVIDTTIPNAQAEIATLKKQLSDTDYQAIKYAEGWLSEEEYAPIKAERQEWRNRINELELIIIEAQIKNA